MIKRLLLDEEGQGMVEYAIVMAIIVLAVFLSLVALGQQLDNKYVDINEKIHYK